MKKMQFIVKQIGSEAERIGAIKGFSNLNDVIIETPCAALLTKGASVVHLTSEVLSKVFTEPQLLWVPLSNSYHLEPGVKAQGDGITKFSALPNHISCVTLNDLSEDAPLGFFEGEHVPLWTRQGKKKITANRYMDVMEAFKPDLILAIADNRTSFNEGQKRISKSVERTCSMLDSVMSRYKASQIMQQKSSILGVIVGSTMTPSWQECIKKLMVYKDELTGVALSGLTEGGDEADKVTLDQLEPAFRQIGQATPNDMLRIVEGPWNPVAVLTAIQHGWDVFDGTYALQLTNRGQALKLHFSLDNHEEEFCILDLGDQRYREEFAPILEGCECLACKKHTRAYINHLLNTKEMLAQVLLHIHNLHHFSAFFARVRRHIQEGTFHAFRRCVALQYERYAHAQGTRENGDVKPPAAPARLKNPRMSTKETE